MGTRDIVRLAEAAAADGKVIRRGPAAWLAVAMLAAVRPGASAPPGARQPAPTRAATMGEQPVPPQVRVTVPPFTLTASLERSVPEGRPVVLELAIRNGGTERLMIGGSAFEPSAFHITVTDGAGRPVPRTAAGERVLTPPTAVYANSTVMLAPGQTRRYRLNLARLFDLSRTGVYAVSVSRTLAPWPFPVAPPKAGMPAPPTQTDLAVGPMRVHMTEDADAVSGPTALAPPPAHQTFLYMANRYNPGVSRYRVGGDGGVSFALTPDTPSTGTPVPPPALGLGPEALAVSPDGRYLYTGVTGNNTVAQYRIGDDGVLSPLSPPTVPAHKFPWLLLMDPKGRFLYALSSWGNSLYAVGPDGRLAVTALTPADVWAKDSDLNVEPCDAATIDPTGTFLYACNGQTSVYRLAPDGRATFLPMLAAGTNGGRENAIALSPSGKFAFVGVSTEGKPGGFDLVVPMRVAPNGTLTPVPGGAKTPQEPPYPKGFQPYQCSTLAVDPTGRFLMVVNPDCLDCFRIGPDGSLAPLSMTEQQGRLDSVSFAPGSSIAYVHSATPPSLLAFRLDDRRGLIPADLDMPEGVPFDAVIAAAVAPTPLRGGPNVGGLEMAALLRADVLPASKPVVLTVMLRNVTSRPIRLGAAGADLAAFRLSLTGPQRQSPGVLRGGGEPAAGAVPLLAAGHDLLDTPGAGGAALVLPAGGQRQYRLILSRLADLTVAGNYTVQVSRVLPGGKEVGSPVLHFLLNGPFNGIARGGRDGNGLDVL